MLGTVDTEGIVAALLDWFARNARDLPWRRTRDPYAIWVSEIMLQQTQVRTVIPYWERWMRELPDVGTLAAASAEKLHKLWEGLGYYSRVANMKRAATIIRQDYGGRIPERFDELVELPGVGRYTAGAICSIAYNQPVPVLDGNVLRVLSRLFLVEGNPREGRVRNRLWRLAGNLVQAAAKGPSAATRSGRRQHRPIGRVSALNQSLMELGALVCTPRAPLCRECPLVRRCAARRQGIVNQLPRPVPRARTIPRRVHAFVISKRGRVLVRRRPVGGVNAQLWEFPNFEVTGAADAADCIAKPFRGAILCDLRPLCVIKHSITRYRITMEVFAGTLGGRKPVVPEGRWVRWKDLDRLPFASAHRRIISHLPGT